MSKTKAVIATLVVLVAMGLGIWRSVSTERDEPITAGEVQTLPASPSRSGLSGHDGHDHDDQSAPRSQPTNDVTDRGGDHSHDEEEVPAAERPKLVARADAFWKAFSIRDAKNRDAALAKVAVPYLAKKMSVTRTERIPNVAASRSAVVGGSFSMAVVVTEATSADWWYAVFVFDPAHGTWNAQEYQKATPQMINDALVALGEKQKEES